MTCLPVTHAGYQLLHEGALALSQIQLNGMRVDVPAIELDIRRISQKRIPAIEARLNVCKEVKIWKEMYGLKFNLDSDDQLRELLYSRLKLKPFKETEKSSEDKTTGSTDEESLKALEKPWLLDLIERRKLGKVLGTNLEGILREQVNGMLHPFFNLLLISYRSSSSNINFQNIPKHEEELKRLVRTKFIPRTRRRLLGEVDYSKAEVIGSCCYHKDPNMIAEVMNPELDMHRDIACECYLLELDEWTGDIRFAGKNNFTFAQFYGDYYVTCAKNLWNAIQQLKLVTKKGVPLYDHLRKKGIRNLAQFEKHIEQVEQRFWGKRFPVYAKWKDDWVKLYHRQGYVDSLTGFRYQGVMTRNEVCNYPIQGSSFHFLLWSITQLQKIAVEEKWESKILGQIHDALVFDFEPSEINHIVEVVNRVMCTDVRKHWPWIIVPLKVDLELGPAGASWYHLKKAKEYSSGCTQCGNKWLYKDLTCPVCAQVNS